MCTVSLVTRLVTVDSPITDERLVHTDAVSAVILWRHVAPSRCCIQTEHTHTHTSIQLASAFGV